MSSTEPHHESHDVSVIARKDAVCAHPPLAIISNPPTEMNKVSSIVLPVHTNPSAVMESLSIEAAVVAVLGQLGSSIATSMSLPLTETECQSSSGLAPTKPFRVLSIPVELKTEVFKMLDPVSSACLGLTCKDFYAVHKRLRVVVKLSERLYGVGWLSSSWYGRSELRFVLENWAGDELRYSTSSRRFVKRDELPTHKIILWVI